MVRIKKHNGTDFLLIDTSITVYNKDNTETVVPVQVQIRVGKVPEKSFNTFYNYACSLFDRPFTANKPKLEEKKGWFQRLFQK